MRNIFKINLFTYILLVLSMLAGYYKDILTIYFILIIHEVGHYIIMRYYSINIKSITLYPYGGLIKSDMLINTNSYKVLLISLGGIIIQCIFSIIFFILYKIGYVGNSYYFLFNKYNFYIILFNLLPMFPLDGFKIFNSLIEIFFSFKLSIKISIIFNFITLILFILYLYFYRINNYIIITFLLTSLINYLISFKYILNKFYLERIIYNINYNGLISVSDKSKMFKNKFNYINGVREDEYLKYLVN